MPDQNLLAAVVTTIQPPTSSLRSLNSTLRRWNADLWVVGDAQGPAEIDLPGASFLSFDDQAEMSFSLAQKSPANHYSRKNIGYLAAIARRASCIYETDDDNAPNGFWSPRTKNVQALDVEHNGWVNVYRLFSDQHIWPRGFPLDEIRSCSTSSASLADHPGAVDAPIQQGLANGSPDVDAIWRLVLDRDITFNQRPSVRLLPGSWCPFNSQSTWWWPVAFPLMYLPSHCSFRMTDIWRSLIAQRCLWAHGQGVVFHAAEVNQVRNPHNLVADFVMELDGYLLNRSIVSTLEELSLNSNSTFDAICENLSRCYEALCDAGHLDWEEIPLVETWLADLRAIQFQRVYPAEAA